MWWYFLGLVEVQGQLVPPVGCFSALSEDNWVHPGAVPLPFTPLSLSSHLKVHTYPLSAQVALPLAGNPTDGFPDQLYPLRHA